MILRVQIAPFLALGCAIVVLGHVIIAVLGAVEHVVIIVLALVLVVVMVLVLDVEVLVLELVEVLVLVLVIQLVLLHVDIADVLVDALLLVLAVLVDAEEVVREDALMRLAPLSVRHVEDALVAHALEFLNKKGDVYFVRWSIKYKII